MGKLSKFRVLLTGILSVPAAVVLGIFVYMTLTRASVDKTHDFVFRLTAVIVAMWVPFLLTLLLAWADRRRSSLSRSAKLGIAISVLSLGLSAVPIRGLIGRVQQSRNMSLHDVAAPAFDTVDLTGKPQRLQDHLGKVVLINAWGTWCPPCKKEMPELDRLYREHKDEGFIVFGISTEEADLQRTFVKEKVPVSYPLLGLTGKVPNLYTDIQAWPTIFLVDRQGRLQPAPPAGQSFEKIEAAVVELLKSKSVKTSS